MDFPGIRQIPGIPGNPRNPGNLDPGDPRSGPQIWTLRPQIWTPGDPKSGPLASLLADPQRRLTGSRSEPDLRQI